MVEVWPDFLQKCIRNGQKASNYYNLGGKQK